MRKKIRVHDGIVGTVILLSAVLGYNVDKSWLIVTGTIAALMVFSALSGFCPVYFILNKVMPPDKDEKCC